MKKAIVIENLSKKYLINHENKSGNTLVETLSHAIKKPFKKKSSSDIPTTEDFWALKDITFSVEEGDRVGIIGRNGAGKSTLLKILSQITEPTTGSVTIRGRLSSLLEVGTGFHPELTGRENIFLNGAILGMKKSEIKKKFDEIVDFAEIERFLDTPVKRYSSGMYMRLGFAIAAHLDSDIMIIDEVLAVGDAQFQAKCFKKLNTLGTSGRTILFVSHDTNSVLSLCNKGLFLEGGKINTYGSIDTCVNAYVKRCGEELFCWEGVSGDEHLKIYSVKLENTSKNQFFYQNEKPIVTIDYEVLKPHPDLFLSLAVWNSRNQLLARSQTFDSDAAHEKFSLPGRKQLSFTLDASLFNPGEYLVKLHAAIHNVKKISDEAIALRLPIYSASKTTRYTHSLEHEGIHLGHRWDWNS